MNVIFPFASIFLFNLSYINLSDLDEQGLATHGCTDSNACNFNQEAQIDDGSCYYPFTDTFNLENIILHPVEKLILPFQATNSSNFPIGSEGQFNYYTFVTAMGWNTLNDELKDTFNPITGEQISEGLFSRTKHYQYSGGNHKMTGLIDFGQMVQFCLNRGVMTLNSHHLIYLNYLINMSSMLVMIMG